jgi:hypothetical protein
MSMAMADRTNNNPEPAPPVRRTPEEIAKMSPAERLDCVRQWDQRPGQQPEWRDPRLK